MDAAELTRFIRDIPDHPQPGVMFRDITPLLRDSVAFSAAVEALAAPWLGAVDAVAGVEARGFVFGAPVAQRLGVGFVPVRKPGKLPWATTSVSYELEYGTDAVEIHTDAVAAGDRVLLVDDVLATGGTAGAALTLLTGAGAAVVGASFLIELSFLTGRARLDDVPVSSVITYD